MKKITGIIITLNEEKNIKDCIESLNPLCPEILVVDSGSWDKTQEIARSMGAKVIVQPYLGDGPQKNVGLQYASNDWVFSLDADERLTPELIKCIEALDLESTAHDGFYIKRRNYIGRRWIKVCGWYPDHFIRLYNRKKTQFAEVLSHARVNAQNPGYLEADLIHFSYRHAAELFQKGDRFSTRGAKELWKKGRRSHFYSPLLHGALAFTKKYFFKWGFLGGADGFTVALSAGMNSYLKWLKLGELEKNPELQKKPDLWNL